MKQITVREIMVPLKEYATIHQDSTLFEAVMALEKAQEEYSRADRKYLHRAILVYDDKERIVGKLSQLDILRSLEPKYKQAAAGDSGHITASGFSQEFMRNMVRQFALWDKPMMDLCKKATRMKAKNCMYVPQEGEYVKEGDSLDLAIHQLVMGHHQSLLATDRRGKIVGILRLTDVFKQIVDAMKECNL
ncbi:MAG: CBS domain-containing protein [Desulfobacteraceae bacterium]|nr:CBS domain-containing protein [Desulfobacteraceae bacterium]MCF8094759.1 CBS domain-containing protein [Desulfobacteraceae bacterium]